MSLLPQVRLYWRESERDAASRRVHRVLMFTLIRTDSPPPPMSVQGVSVRHPPWTE